MKKITVALLCAVMAVSLFAAEPETGKAEKEKQILGNTGAAAPAQAKYCTKCGHPNETAYKFCEKCGNPLQ